MLLEHKIMVFQVHRIGCVWKTPFRKSGRILLMNTKGSNTMNTPLILLMIAEGGTLLMITMEHYI